jgi:hypothetical protein
MLKTYVLSVLCCVSTWLPAQQSSGDTLQPKLIAAQKKAVSFLTQKEHLKSQNLLLIIEYLQRAYDLQISVNATDLLHRAPVYEDEKQQMRYFGKLYGVHNKITKREITAQHGLIQLMAWSINADVYKPDGVYSKEIWRYSEAKGRDITHAALCLAWIKEQHMQKYIANYDSLERYQVLELQTLAQNEDYSSDTGLEALVGLIRLGYSSLIKDEYIVEILNAQLKDGGWPQMTQDDTSSNEHTTILALWVLLNRQHQGIAKTKWILN